MRTGQGALLGGATGGVGYGITAGLRAAGSRITAAHRNAIQAARNDGARLGPAKANSAATGRAPGASPSPRRPSTALVVPSVSSRALIAFTMAMRDPNRIHHIFGKPGHGFDALRSQLGGSESAILKNALGLAMPRVAWVSSGVQNIKINLRGAPLTLTGRIIDGNFRLSTMFIDEWYLRALGII